MHTGPDHVALPNSPAAGDQGRRFVVFAPNWVGDAVMATPAFDALRRHFPQAQVLAVLRPVVDDTLAGLTLFDQVQRFDPRAADPALRTTALLRALRAFRADTALLFTHSFRTALLARCSGARRRVGLARHGRRWLLSDALPVPRRRGKVLPAPVLDDYLRIVAALGIPAPRAPLRLATLPADRALVEALWQRWRFSGPVVALNCSGAFGAAKLWPREYFAALAFRLATQSGAAVLVLCGPAERETAREIVRRAGHPRVVSLAEETLSIGLTQASIERSQLLVTTDSGPRHFAAAFNVPVVTLFGPTHPAWSETYFPRAVHLQHAVPCGPCQKRTCPLGHHECLRGLSVDEVYRAAVAQLERYGEQRAA